MYLAVAVHCQQSSSLHCLLVGTLSYCQGCFSAQLSTTTCLQRLLDSLLLPGVFGAMSLLTQVCLHCCPVPVRS